MPILTTSADIQAAYTNAESQLSERKTLLHQLANSAEFPEYLPHCPSCPVPPQSKSEKQQEMKRSKETMSFQYWGDSLISWNLLNV